MPRTPGGTCGSARTCCTCDGDDVLVVSPLSDRGEEAGDPRYVDETVYSVGSLDLTTARFTGSGFTRVDAGPDFYAPQSFVDSSGRTIMVAWMGMPDHDGQPELAVKHPTVANGWVHCLTVPRVLSLDGDALVQWPVAELEALRGEPTRAAGVEMRADTSLGVAGLAGTALDIELSATASPAARSACACARGTRATRGDHVRPVGGHGDPGSHPAGHRRGRSSHRLVPPRRSVLTRGSCSTARRSRCSSTAAGWR